MSYFINPELLKNPYIFWLTLLIANLLMFFSTILLSYIWASVYKHKMLPLTKKDLKTSIYVLLVNIMIALPGYFLFINSKITFSENGFWIDIIWLFFLFDFMMYILHYASHTLYPFKLLHEKHHEHEENFNSLSLYVMHPAEAASLGLLITVVTFLFSPNFYSFIAFIIINWLMGLISHLNTSSQKEFILGNNMFHKIHHKKYHYNYGFYTIIWDKIFGTYLKN